MSGLTSCVFIAASDDENDVVEDYLVNLGNDVNEKDDLGLTGLHRCASKGAVAAAHTYLVYGANFNIPDRESGWSVLHRSVYFQHIKLSFLLIAFGAQMEDTNYSNIKDRAASQIDNDGFTPMGLLSRVLSPDLVAGDRTVNVVYCYGKSDFTLGIPLPNAPVVAHAKRVETLLDKQILQVCASKHHSLAVTEEGNLFAWGYGRWGRLGLGSAVDQPEPCLIHSLFSAKVRVKQVASGENHAIAVTMDGDVYTWGSDRCGQLGHGNALLRAHSGSSNSQDKDASKDIMLLEPRRVEALGRVFVLQVAAGDAHSLCLAKHDELYAWGSNKSGQLGLRPAELSHLHGGAEGCNTPKLVLVDHAGRVRTSAVSKPVGSVRGRPRNEVILQVAASHNNSLLLCRTVHLEAAQGGLVRGSVGTEVFQWGHGLFELVKVHFATNKENRGGAKTKASLAGEFTAVGKTRFVNIKELAVGQHHFAGVSADGCVYTWNIAPDYSAQEQAAIGPARKEERVDERLTAKGCLSTPRLLDAMLPERGGGLVTHIAASSSRMSATTADGDLFTWDLHNTVVYDTYALLVCCYSGRFTYMSFLHFM